MAISPEDRAFDRLVSKFPKRYQVKGSEYIRGTLKGFAVGDGYIETQVDAVRDNLIAVTAVGRHLDRRGGLYGVKRGRGAGVVDTDFQKLIPLLGLSPKQITHIMLKIIDIMYGPYASRANVTAGAFAPYDLEDLYDLRVRVDDTEITITFEDSDFINIDAATAQEVATAVSNKTKGRLVGSVLTDARTSEKFVNIRTSTIGSQGFIQVLGGESQRVFQFPEVRPVTQGLATWDVTRFLGTDEMVFTHTAGLIPDLKASGVIRGDFISIREDSGFDIDNTGTYEISFVGDTSFRLINPDGVVESGITQNSADDFTFFRPDLGNVLLSQRPAAIVETSSKELTVLLPVTSPITKRTLRGGQHFHGAVTRVTDIEQSFGNTKSVLFNNASSEDGIFTPTANIGSSITNKFTSSIWVKSTGTVNSGGVWGHWDATIAQRKWLVWTGPFASNNDHALIYLSSDGVAEEKRYLYDSNVVFGDSMWHHIVVVYDGTLPTADQLKTYIDGTLATPNKQNDADLPTLHNSTADYFFASVAGNLLNTISLESPSVWNIAMNATEVAELNNSQTPFFLTQHSRAADLQAWWRMGDDPSDTTSLIVDQIGSNDITLRNTPTIVTDVPNVLLVNDILVLDSSVGFPDPAGVVRPLLDRKLSESVIESVSGSSVTLLNGQNWPAAGAFYSNTQKQFFFYDNLSGDDLFNVSPAPPTSIVGDTVQYVEHYTYSGVDGNKLTGVFPEPTILGLEGKEVATAGAEIIEDFPGSFLFDPSAPFTASELGSQLSEDIFQGDVKTLLLVDDVSEWPEEGSFVLEFNHKEEEGPIRYLSRIGDSALIIDPSHIFEKEHLIGTGIRLIRQIGAIAPRVDGSDLMVFTTSTSPARDLLAEYLRLIAASGISFRFIIKVPEQKWAVIPNLYSTDPLADELVTI